MPLKWVEPKEFFNYKNVSIYHCYKNNSINDMSEYWYTTDISENDDFEFDVRELNVPEEIKNRNDHEEMIKYYIDNDLFLIPE